MDDNTAERPTTPTPDESGGNTPFACPGRDTNTTVREMLEYGGWIWGEDGSALDLPLSEWIKDSLEQGRASWNDKTIPCLQCPHCQVIFSIDIIQNALQKTPPAQ